MWHGSCLIRVKSVQVEDRRFGPFLARLLGEGSLVTGPLVQKIEGGDGLVNGDIGRVEGSQEVLLTLCLRVRLQELTGGKSGLDVSDAVLVVGQERLVEFLKLLGLREELLEFGVNNLGSLGGERLGEAIKGLAESDELKVEGGVGRVDSMSGLEALQGEQMLVCRMSY